MSNNKNIKEYAKLQYRNHQNLDNRINLWSYGSNPESLQKWIFSKIQLQKHERLLELGCGTGKLWLENFRNVPSIYSIVLSDFSKNMLNKAKENLQLLNLPISYELINAEQIHYPNRAFDVILACHMLYHVPNIDKALVEINRVLKPNGRFIATTTSQKHIQELRDFLSEFGIYNKEKKQLFNEFNNEKGEELLKPFFAETEFNEYINQVNITSVDPLMKYIETMYPKEKYPEFQEIKPQIEDAILEILEKKSRFQITGISGLFKAKKPIII